MSSGLIYGNQPQSPALGFGGGHNSSDLCRDFAEDYECGFSLQSIDFAERYIKAELDVVIELLSATQSSKYHLVFSAIPICAVEVNRTSIDIGAPFHFSDRSSNRADQAVFAGITCLVQSPNKVIASFVRLERAKERQDIRRQILASAAADDIVFEACGIVGDREAGFFRAGTPPATAAA